MSTLLCVDDERSVLNSLRRLFLDEPWDVLLAAGGAEGLELLEEMDVDLVMADFRMPGMNGVEFLKRVRALRPDCMRVVLSGYADIALIVSALNEGQIYKFISKPWNDDELRDTIRKLLLHQEVEREIRRLDEELKLTNAVLTQRIHELEAALAAPLHVAGLAESALPVLGVGPQGRILLASRGARELLGADPAGKDLTALGLPALPEAGAALHACRLRGAEVLLFRAP